MGVWEPRRAGLFLNETAPVLAHPPLTKGGALGQRGEQQNSLCVELALRFIAGSVEGAAEHWAPSILN